MYQADIERGAVWKVRRLVGFVSQSGASGADDQITLLRAESNEKTELLSAVDLVPPAQPSDDW